MSERLRRTLYGFNAEEVNSLFREQEERFEEQVASAKKEWIVRLRRLEDEKQDLEQLRFDRVQQQHRAWLAALFIRHGVGLKPSKSATSESVDNEAMDGELAAILSSYVGQLTLLQQERKGLDRDQFWLDAILVELGRVRHLLAVGMGDTQ